MKLIPLLLLSSILAGCGTYQHEVSVTEVKKLPNKAVLKKSYTASVSNSSIAGGKFQKRRVEYYVIGPTLDSEGKIVPPFKVFRVVDTARWVFNSSKAEHESVPTPLKRKPDPEITHVKQDTAQEQQKASEESVQNSVAPETQPRVSTEDRQDMQEALSKFSIPETKKDENQQIKDFANGQP